MVYKKMILKCNKCGEAVALTTADKEMKRYINTEFKKNHRHKRKEVEE